MLSSINKFLISIAEGISWGIVGTSELELLQLMLKKRIRKINNLLNVGILIWDFSKILSYQGQGLDGMLRIHSSTKAAPSW